jgi:hypothetical protein
MKLTPALFLLSGLAWPAWAAPVNDFPTADRVVYVQECMRANPGPHYEMLNKCSCALDALAKQIKYADYVTLSTISNAMTIGGERGAEFRDNETLKPPLARYRELQAQVQKGCFINPPAR